MHLVKKCYELSKLCDMKIILIIKDPKHNAIYQYNSDPIFKLNQMIDAITTGEMTYELDYPHDQRVPNFKPRKNYVLTQSMEQFLDEKFDIEAINNDIGLKITKNNRVFKSTNSDQHQRIDA